MSAAIETHALTRRYGPCEAVSGLTLEVPVGRVYALLGPNGAGKTTTLKMLMNVVEPTAGSARVLGRPTTALGPGELRRIGYVSENQEQPAWMTVRQLLAYYRPFYPCWDEAFCSRLRDRLELPLDRKLRDLSRGMRMKVALLSSLAYRPELLVLDEPFSGLDPLVRDELVSGVLELTEQESWTVLLSSHDVDEVERLADWVGILDGGRLRLSESLESLQGRFRRLELTTVAPAVLPPSLPERWLGVEVAGDRVCLVESRFHQAESEAEARRVFGEVRHLTLEPISLREILVALAKQFRVDARRVSGGVS